MSAVVNVSGFGFVLLVTTDAACLVGLNALVVCDVPSINFEDLFALRWYF